MHQIILKIFYFLLAMMIAGSINTAAFAASPIQKDQSSQSQAQQDDDEDDDEDQDDNEDEDDDDNGDDDDVVQSVAPPQVGEQSTFTQGGQPVGPQQGDFQQQSQQGVQQGQFGQQDLMASGVCAQVYTVQAGDTLGDIANRFLGSIDSYQLIVDATNAAAASNQQAGFQQSSLQQGQQQGATQQGTTQGTAQQQQDTDEGTTQQETTQGTVQQQQGTMQQGTDQGAMQQAQQQVGSGFARIDDPNIIQVGQTLCIPSSQQTLAQQGQPGGMQQGGFQQTGNQNQQQQGMMADLFNIPQGKSKIVFENLSSTDLIVDISQGPTPQSLWVGPGQQQVFVVDPGVYTFMGHQPGGEFGLVPGELRMAPDTLIGVTCYDSGQCQAHGVQQLMAMMDNTNQNMGQNTQQQQGTGQGTTQ